MRLAYHLVFFECIAVAAIATFVSARQYFDHSRDQLSAVSFCAICLLLVIGALAYILQFFAKRTGRILAFMFFGFLAGMMATNFISEIVSGTTYPSVSGYLNNYGLMLFVLSMAVAGLTLSDISCSRDLQNTDSPANGGQPLSQDFTSTPSAAGPRR